jgi:hypothetical protein
VLTGWLLDCFVLLGVKASPHSFVLLGVEASPHNVISSAREHHIVGDDIYSR